MRHAKRGVSGPVSGGTSFWILRPRDPYIGQKQEITPLHPLDQSAGRRDGTLVKAFQGRQRKCAGLAMPRKMRQSLEQRDWGRLFQDDDRIRVVPPVMTTEGQVD